MTLPVSRMKYAYLVLVVTFLISLFAFAYVGHFTRYMADDYCLAYGVNKLGFTNAQTQLYMGWTGRYTYGFLMSIAESIGPATVPFGPFIALVCWLAAAVWLIYQLALICRWPHPIQSALLLAELIIFAMLNCADNIVQSLYWQGGLVNYVVPLILLTTYAGIVSHAVRKNPAGRAALPLLILSALVTFFAGGLTEAYGVLQTAGLLLSLIACYMWAWNPFRRPLIQHLVAGLVGSLIAISIVTVAPGNKFRQAFFPPPPNLLRLTKVSLYYAGGFIATEFVHSPLTVLALVVLPATLAFCMRLSKSDSDRELNLHQIRRVLVLLPLVGFFLIFSCFATGVYAVAGALPERARFIPEFVFVCTAVGWAYFAGAALANRFSVGEPKTYWLRAVGMITLMMLILAAPMLATWRTLKLVPRARAAALIWDQMDRDVRAAKAQGARDITVPAVDDVETRLGARSTELQIDHDPNNWKNKCVAQYYGVDFIIAR